MNMSYNSQNKYLPPKSLPPHSIPSNEGLGYQSSGNDQNATNYQQVPKPLVVADKDIQNPMKSIGQLFVRNNIQKSVYSQFGVGGQVKNLKLQQEKAENQTNLHLIDQNEQKKMSHSFLNQQTTTSINQSTLQPVGKGANVGKKQHRFTDVKALAREKKNTMKRQSTKPSFASPLILQNSKLGQDLGRKSKNYWPPQANKNNRPESNLSINGTYVQNEYVNDRMAQAEYEMHRLYLINRVKVPEFVLSFQDFQEIEIPTIRDLRFEGAEIMDKDTAYLLESKYSNKRQNSRFCSRVPRYVWIIVVVVILIVILCLGLGLGIAYG